MSFIRSREVAVATAGISAAVALSIGAALLAPPSDDGLPAGSSLSTGYAGSAAAYQLLQDLGYDVRRSVDPVTSAQIDSASVYILADPAEEASAADRRWIQTLITNGATVLVTGCRGASFLVERSGSDGGDSEPRKFAAATASPLVAGAPEITMEPSCPRPDLPPRFTALYGDARVDVVRAARIGRGLAMWWAGNTPLENSAIDTPGNLELVLKVAGAAGRTIVWDEFYHGQRRSLISYARQTPLPWMAAQLALVAMVAGAMYVRRRAPIIEPFVEPRVSPLEFVSTMGGLYARAGTAADAVATARARLRRLLLDVTGLAASADDRHLADAAARRVHIDANELASALADAAREEGAVDVPPERALNLVQRLQRLAAIVEKRGG